MRKPLIAAVALLVVAAAAPAQGFENRWPGYRYPYQIYTTVYVYPAVANPGYPQTAPYYLPSGGALGTGHVYSGHYYSGHVFDRSPYYGQSNHRP